MLLMALINSDDGKTIVYGHIKQKQRPKVVELANTLYTSYKSLEKDIAMK